MVITRTEVVRVELGVNSRVGAVSCCPVTPKVAAPLLRCTEYAGAIFASTSPYDIDINA